LHIVCNNLDSFINKNISHGVVLHFLVESNEIIGGHFIGSLGFNVHIISTSRIVDISAVTIDDIHDTIVSVGNLHNVTQEKIDMFNEESRRINDIVEAIKKCTGQQNVGAGDFILTNNLVPGDYSGAKANGTITYTVAARENGILAGSFT
jgi:hypothetical protein